ncbi:MAG: S1 RNA-binding domain-containing protein [Robiginitomaculum sp.]|nr:S1 RNA-binding domain-containing protein [Robiginitomaculum sp.]
MSTAQDSLNPTIDDFAAMLEASLENNNMKEGGVVTGTVTAIEKDIVIVDIGLKTEGRIPLREFYEPGNDDVVKVGDKVEIFLERIENALGDAVLSRDKARREEAWLKLVKECEAKNPVKGAIVGRVKGGFTVDLGGVNAFLPGSQVDIRPVRDITPLMNEVQPFMILKMDRPRNNIVVSRRAILEESRAEQRAELIENLKEGEEREGIVKNITDYGAFVDLGGIDGLLHVTDMSWSRISHPSQILSVGDTIKVKLIRINPETQRISLGIKQLTKDTGTGPGGKSSAPKGKTVTCTVTEVNRGGIEVLFGEEGAETKAFIRKNDLSREHSEQRPERFAVGDKVDARVIRTDKRTGQVTLSIKALEIATEKEAVAQYGSSNEGASLGDILGAAMKDPKD